LTQQPPAARDRRVWAPAAARAGAVHRAGHLVTCAPTASWLPSLTVIRLPGGRPDRRLCASGSCAGFVAGCNA